jgi:starch-binding outer membrane protein, SusD/RagB family
MLNGGTDEVVLRDGIVDPFWGPFGNGSYTSQNLKLKDNWFVFFAGINRVNYLLEKIDQVDIDVSRKMEITGEAHFLRGLYYYYLAVAYGALPIYTTSDHSLDLQRESVEIVYDLIISDLTFAYETLADRADKPGRADKWSAAGYLSKVYTYLASFKMNNVGEDLNFGLNSFAWVDAAEMYAKSLTVTNDIIAYSGFRLIENYDYLFRETTEAWKAEESLFSLLGSKNVSAGNLNLTLFWQIPLGAPNAGGGYGRLRPLGELFYRYDSTDLRRFHNITQSVKIENPTENIESVIYYIPTPLTDPMEEELCVGKYRYREAADKNISAAWSDGNIILIRYADILLHNAEALYFTGDEPGARSRLREVRARIATDDAHLDSLTAAYYDVDFLTELLDSRSRELCFESWRRIDLIRFGKMDETIAGLSNDLGYWNTMVPVLQANWELYKMWFPIPKSDIELSPLLQNPGYN